MTKFQDNFMKLFYYFVLTRILAQHVLREPCVIKRRAINQPYRHASYQNFNDYTDSLYIVLVH